MTCKATGVKFKVGSKMISSFDDLRQFQFMFDLSFSCNEELITCLSFKKKATNNQEKKELTIKYIDRINKRIKNY